MPKLVDEKPRYTSPANKSKPSKLGAKYFGDKNVFKTVLKKFILDHVKKGNKKETKKGDENVVNTVLNRKITHHHVKKGYKKRRGTKRTVVKRMRVVKMKRN